MSENKKTGLGRREFVMVTAGGVGCLALGGLREAVAQARQTGQPVLTDDALNKFIAKAKADPKMYQEQAAMAQRDLYSFLSKNFTLTDAQNYAVRNLGKENQATLNEAIAASVTLLTEATRTKEPIPREWTPMVVAFSGRATARGTAKIKYEKTETDTPGGGHSTSHTVSAEISY